MHAKGMEVGGYDPRGAKGMGLVYGCGPRGGCHHAGGYTVTAELTNPALDRFADTGKAPITLGSRNRRAGAADSPCTCAFLTIGMEDDTLAALIAAATGQEFAAADLYLTGERVNTLERVFNVREGLRPADDTLPGRLMHEALAEGPLAGQTVDFDLMRAEFYAASGLDPNTSLPTHETLRRLDLEWVMSDPVIASLMDEVVSELLQGFSRVRCGTGGRWSAAPRGLEDLQGHRTHASRAAAVSRTAGRAAHGLPLRGRLRSATGRVFPARWQWACSEPTAPFTRRLSAVLPRGSPSAGTTSTGLPRAAARRRRSGLGGGACRRRRSRARRHS